MKFSKIFQKKNSKQSSLIQVLFIYTDECKCFAYVPQSNKSCPILQHF